MLTWAVLSVPLTVGETDVIKELPAPVVEVTTVKLPAIPAIRRVKTTVVPPEAEATQPEDIEALPLRALTILVTVTRVDVTASAVTRSPLTVIDAVPAAAQEKTDALDAVIPFTAVVVTTTVFVWVLRTLATTTPVAGPVSAKISIILVAPGARVKLTENVFVACG